MPPLLLVQPADRRRLPSVLTAVKGIAVILLAVGMGGFVFQSLVAGGFLGDMRDIAWPVGSTSEAVRFPDGRYAVPLEHIGRIQVYSPDLRFQYGWHVDASAGAFTLLPASGGDLQVYTVRGRLHFVFAPDGSLKSSRVYRDDSESPPRPVPLPAAISIPSPWWAFPLRGPFHSFVVAVTGMVPLIVLGKLDTRASRRRELSDRPPGPFMKVARTAIGVVAFVVWVGVGLVWFYGCLSFLIHCIAERNLIGALVVAPFLLIGCGLLYISLKLLRYAFEVVAGLLQGRAHWG